MLHNESDNENKAKLDVKLRNALKYALDVCVIGASNKIADIEKTNGWSFVLDRDRYKLSGIYLTMSKEKITQLDIRHNLIFDPEKRGLYCKIDQWYYHVDDSAEDDQGARIKLQLRTPPLNPLDDSQFSLSKNNRILLARSILILEKRVGNCSDRAALVAKYLWEHSSGIHRIEIVPTTTFDHCIVIVNRSGKLNQPETWGEAWVIDAWYKSEGILFHASEFKQRMDEIKKFAMIECEELKKINIDSGDAPPQMDVNEVLNRSDIDIRPSVDKYPSYSTASRYPIEYYYQVDNVYPKNIRKHGDACVDKMQHYFFKHQRQFQGCKEEIERRTLQVTVADNALRKVN